MNLLNLPVKPQKNIATLIVKWLRPQQGWYKLNVDGRSLGNPVSSGAGGAIRDYRGDLISGFAIHTGIHSNNFAEFMGLIQGLRIVRYPGLQNIEIIEMDSKLVIDWIKKKRSGMWYLKDFWEEMLRLLRGIMLQFSTC